MCKVTNEPRQPRKPVVLQRPAYKAGDAVIFRCPSTDYEGHIVELRWLQADVISRGKLCGRPIYKLHVRIGRNKYLFENILESFLEPGPVKGWGV